MTNNHPEEPTTQDQDDDLVDEMVEESFPGSDPPSSWAGADTPRGDSAGQA
jgi:hypothetical protein